MKNKLPGVGEIIKPLRQQESVVVFALAGGKFVTKISYNNIRQRWVIETNQRNRDSGLVCYLKEYPEIYHDIRITSVRDSCVYGALVINKERVDYVQLMREVISCNPTMQSRVVNMLKEVDAFKLSDQLAQNVSPTSFASMVGMLSEALSRGRMEILIRDLEKSEYQFGGQIAAILRQKFPKI